MNWLRFGTLAIESLTSTILLAVITAYLLFHRGKSKAAWYLTGYLGALFILLLSYTVRYSVFATAGLATAQVSNLIVFGVVSLIQFAYHYGERLHVRESRIVFASSSVAALAVWVSLFFEQDAARLYDFTAQYYSIMFSPKVSIFVLTGYIWAIVVFVRKITELSKKHALSRGYKTGVFEALRRPGGKPALSARSFTYLCLAYTAISLMYLLFQIEAISRATYTLLFNTGSLITCLLIFIVYVNNSPQPMSIMAKLVGIPLAVVMVAFGIASSALMPLVHSTLGSRYRDDVSLAQLVLDSGGPGQVPPSIAFMLPETNNPARLAYLSEKISSEWADQITGSDANWQVGLIPEIRGLAPSFMYVDLADQSSFFFAYTIKSRGAHYLIGFQYALYRYEVHRFSTRILLAVVIATLIVLFIFPIAFRRGLITPLALMLDAVRQVSSGNYRVRLPITVEDELGQLARGYNAMAASLKDAEGNFKALAENANDGILLLSEEGRFLFVNRRAGEISGYTTETLAGMHFAALLDPGEVDDVASKFADRMAGEGGRRAYETKIRHKAGGLVPVEITGARTVWLGRPADVVIIRDVTERAKAAEAIRAQQEQLLKTDKLASIGALVAGMAHEINNPNQAISMNSRFLSEGLPVIFTLAESTEEADEQVRIGGMRYNEFKEGATAAISAIESSTKRVDHIVQELKRFVRGGTSDRVEPIDINSVIKVVIDLSRHMINKATDHFTTEFATDLPAIYFDRIGFEQVILNLLQNACQALQDKGKSIVVKTELGDSLVHVYIEDQGVGIPGDALPGITESFYTTKDESGGTGLGLSVSLRILKEHNGSLTFESTEGKGTIAHVTLQARTTKDGQKHEI